MRKIFIALVLLIPAIALAQQPQMTPEQQRQAMEMIARLQAAQIAEHVPSVENFPLFLERDLKAYFADRRASNPSVSVTLLRQQPTQTGVAFPKYYAWVEVTAAGKPFASGAVRLAAMRGEEFMVTDFLPRETILASPAAAEAVFPAALIPAIRQYAAR